MFRVALSQPAIRPGRGMPEVIHPGVVACDGRLHCCVARLLVHQIGQLLRRDNIFITRRTVAKYREQMQIPGSRERKIGYLF